jgi:NAD(P)-dependent dehydrogenase (short-subunit alcohol dehydrogenase family)
MELGLRGARALITGGSRGIGFAIADALAAEGASVGLVARGADGLASAAGRLARHGMPVTTAAADVTDTAALGRALEDVAALQQQRARNRPRTRRRRERGAGWGPAVGGQTRAAADLGAARPETAASPEPAVGPPEATRDIT